MVQLYLFGINELICINFNMCVRYAASNGGKLCSILEYQTS